MLAFPLSISCHMLYWPTRTIHNGLPREKLVLQKLIQNIRTFSKSEASNVKSFMSLTASKKFLMFSKYWIADCAAPSADWTVTIGLSTTYYQKIRTSFFHSENT